jgi:hypothetical protein
VARASAKRCPHELCGSPDRRVEIPPLRHRPPHKPHPGLRFTHRPSRFGVVGLQAILRVLSGQESTLAIVASTLAIAALFNPLRRRVQAFVDRRFYRKKYDARKTLEAFSGRLRDETDLNTLSGNLVKVVRETMQPAHVSLWVRQGPQDEPSDRQTEV